MVDYTDIKVRIEGAVGHIVLNRPTKLNAISLAILEELPLALLQLEESDLVRAIVISGSEQAFSTGADLSQAVEIDSPKKSLKYNRMWRDATYLMEHLSKPVIAAINGHCLTGGLELAMACDIRIAGRGATFAITSSKIGSVAGAGGTQRLPRLVGPSVAMELLFTARTIDADEALSIGLVNRVVEDSEVLKAAEDLVTTIATRGPLSIMWIKRAVHTGVNTDLDSSLDLEASFFSSAFSSKDKAEGMTAFLEKRDPVFRGE